LVLDREFETQSVDPMFLEPESGLAWYDASRKDLELVVGTQSPYEAAESVAYLLGNAQAAFKPARINSNFAYCGGGFGGRDHTPFPLYVALAAMFFPNRPVRLANDRFEQFQSESALAKITRIGVDQRPARWSVCRRPCIDGGGLANFRARWRRRQRRAGIRPEVDVTTYAFHCAVTAGCARTGLQAMTALGVLVDRSARRCR
jgi:hypothetical protein